jgi:hypothetical protein
LMHQLVARIRDRSSPPVALLAGQDIPAPLRPSKRGKRVRKFWIDTTAF